MGTHPRVPLRPTQLNQSKHRPLLGPNVPERRRLISLIGCVHQMSSVTQGVTQCSRIVAATNRFLRSSPRSETKIDQWKSNNARTYSRQIDKSFLQVQRRQFRCSAETCEDIVTLEVVYPSCMCNGSRRFDYAVALYLMTPSYRTARFSLFFSSEKLLKLRGVNIPAVIRAL